MSKRVRSDKCKHCGLPESEHEHAFEAAIVPVGCKCDPTTWRGNEPSNAICDSYESEDLYEGNCYRCEHSVACHGGRA